MCVASSSNADRSPRSPRGVTLVELIVTIAVMSIVMMATLPLFTVTNRGFTSLEVNSVLPAATQEVLNKIQHRVVENRRIFDNTTVGNSFLARATPNVGPVAVSWSSLPTVATNMSLSVSSGIFVSTNVGNSLFFASVYRPYSEDLTPFGMAGVTARVDGYMFNYYYLSENAATQLGGRPALELWEWHSKPYADVFQLYQMPVAKREAVGRALYARGLRFGWDSSVNNPNTAFSTLSSTGGVIPVAGHLIEANTDPQLKPKKMLKLVIGSASGGFKYGISRNTTGGFVHRHRVPGYATAVGEFPGGFETMVVGPSGGRQVFLRLVTVAQGNFKGLMSFENVLLVTSRDFY